MSALRAHLQPHLIMVGFFISRFQVELLVVVTGYGVGFL